MWQRNHFGCLRTDLALAKIAGRAAEGARCCGASSCPESKGLEQEGGSSGSASASACTESRRVPAGCEMLFWSMELSMNLCLWLAATRGHKEGCTPFSLHPAPAWGAHLGLVPVGRRRQLLSSPERERCGLCSRAEDRSWAVSSAASQGISREPRSPLAVSPGVPEQRMLTQTPGGC